VTRYQVKCSDRPIVAYEEFLDRYNKFEDGTVCNWFLAVNLEGETPPGPAGRKESFTVTGVPAGAKYFAVRSFDDVSNRGPVGKVAEVR